jgi:hypothetical protein
MPSISAQKHFANGYQAALLDVEEALRTGGADAVREWLKSNIRTYHSDALNHSDPDA